MADADLQLYAGLVAASLVFAAMMGGLFFYLALLASILKLCQPRHRVMRPVAVYYGLIPLFNLAWLFWTIAWVARSLRWEFNDRGIFARGSYGKELGITTIALWWMFVFGALLPFAYHVIFPSSWNEYLPGVLIGVSFGIPTAICTVLHWMKMSEYHRQLLEGESYCDEGDARYRANWRKSDGKRRH